MLRKIVQIDANKCNGCGLCVPSCAEGAIKIVDGKAVLAADNLCFNGDFNWFDVDDAGFRAVNERVLRHDAILGNVEAELGAPDDAAGCGCAYPENVDEDVVARSNAIHARLKKTAARHPDLLASISALPMVARYRVGAVRVGVVHGDADSLAGWRFDPSSLDDPRDARFAAVRDAFVSNFTERGQLGAAERSRRGTDDRQRF